MSLLYAVLICLHILAATYWVGGMAALYFAVRPAAGAMLEPPQRLPFMADALGRFLKGVAAAIGVILLTGFGMVAVLAGYGRVHWRIHVMIAIALLMMALYGHLRFGVYPKLQQAVAARDFPVAGARMESIRRMVAINLALGVLLFVIVLIGRVG